MINEIHFLNEGLFSSLFKKKDTEEDKEINILKNKLADCIIYTNICNQYYDIINTLSNPSISKINISNIKEKMEKETYRNLSEIDTVNTNYNDRSKEQIKLIDRYCDNENDPNKLQEKYQIAINRMNRFTIMIEKVFDNFIKLKLLNTEIVNGKPSLSTMNEDECCYRFSINHEEFEILGDFICNLYHDGFISLYEIYTLFMPVENAKYNIE